MYKKAIAGQIKDFSGISAIYENPDIVINTENLSIDDSVNVILNHIKKIYSK